MTTPALLTKTINLTEALMKDYAPPMVQLQRGEITSLMLADMEDASLTKEQKIIALLELCLNGMKHGNWPKPPEV